MISNEITFLSGGHDVRIKPDAYGFSVEIGDSLDLVIDIEGGRVLVLVGNDNPQIVASANIGDSWEQLDDAD